MENNKKIMLPQSKQDDTKVKQDATSTDAATVTATAADAATLPQQDATSTDAAAEIMRDQAKM